MNSGITSEVLGKKTGGDFRAEDLARALRRRKLSRGLAAREDELVQVIEENRQVLLGPNYQKLETLFDLLLQCSLIFTLQGLDRIEAKLIHNLVLFALCELRPHKPTGLGSESKECPDAKMRVSDFETLIGQIRKIERGADTQWIGESVADALSDAKAKIEFAKSELRKNYQIYKYVPALEADTYWKTCKLIGKKNTKFLFNNFIEALDNRGFFVRENARRWYPRVRAKLREKPSLIWNR